MSLTASAWNRRLSAPGAREATPLLQPLATDLLGTDVRYYAVVDGAVFVSTSVRSLCQRLAHVTLHHRALAEILAFGFVLDDETVVREVRSIPANATLGIDGTVTRHDVPAWL